MCLQSDVPVELVDNEKNAAVISYTRRPEGWLGNLSQSSPSTPGSSSTPNTSSNAASPSGGGGGSDENQLLATFRCQQNTLRLDLRVRTLEGFAGTFALFVMPRIAPKVSQVCARVRLG